MSAALSAMPHTPRSPIYIHPAQFREARTSAALSAIMPQVILRTAPQAVKYQPAIRLQAELWEALGAIKSEIAFRQASSLRPTVKPAESQALQMAEASIILTPPAARMALAQAALTAESSAKPQTAASVDPIPRVAFLPPASAVVWLVPEITLPSHHPILMVLSIAAIMLAALSVTRRIGQTSRSLAHLETSLEIQPAG